MGVPRALHSRALAPLAAVQRPEADDVGVAVGAVDQGLHVVLDELGRGVGVGGAVVVPNQSRMPGIAGRP